jgi:hypothetical protein
MAQTIEVWGGDGQEAYTDADFPQTLRARVLDGGPVAGVSVTFRFPPSGPSATFYGGGGIAYTTSTGADGVAVSQPFKANSIAGFYNPSCEVTGHPEIDYKLFSTTNLVRTPPAAASISIIGGNSQKAATNTAYALGLQVRVLDQYGAAFASGPVVFTIPAGRGTFPGSVQTATINTDSLGYATSPIITAGATVGAFNVSTTIAGLSVTFLLTNIDPTVITSWAVFAGNNQFGQVSTPFASPLSVRFFNGAGGGVAGASVTFTAPGSGATCTFPGSATAQTVTSDANGYGTSGTLTANATLGTYTVVASHAGLTSLNFTLNNGNPYKTEVCTAVENGGGAIQSGAGSGLGQQNWTNPASAIGNPGSTTIYAQNITRNGGTRSPGLLFTPNPASWGLIKTDSAISKLTFRCWGRFITGGGSVNNLAISFFKGATVSPAFNTVAYSGFGVEVFAQLPSITFSPSGANALYGADLALAGSGFSLVILGVAGSFSTCAMQINGATVQVCYRDVGYDAFDIPLLLCEA